MRSQSPAAQSRFKNTTLPGPRYAEGPSQKAGNQYNTYEDQQEATGRFLGTSHSQLLRAGPGFPSLSSGRKGRGSLKPATEEKRRVPMEKKIRVKKSLGKPEDGRKIRGKESTPSKVRRLTDTYV